MPSAPPTQPDAIDEPALAPGDRIGDYRVEGVLGSGAFGTVYRAVHTVIGKQAAVKVLKRAFASDATMFARFVGEARAVNAISHPNIVDIFGFGQADDGRQFIVMELLRGESLADVLAVRRKLPLDETIAILRPLAEALIAAHAQGITHRDLKPDNVFLHTPAEGAARQIKLLDFGIARLPPSGPDATPLTRAGWVIGTPGYMSPEQTVGEAVDGRADVFAFGVLAFRMLTGRLPFEGDSLKELLAAQLKGPAPSATLFAPDLPAHLDAALRWLLHHDVAVRCPDVAKALSALEGTLSLPAEALKDPSTTTATVRARAPLPPAEALPPIAMPSLMREAEAARRRSPALLIAALLGIAGVIAFIWVERPEPSADPIAEPEETVAAPTPSTLAPNVPSDLRLVAIDGSPPGAEILSADGTRLGTVPTVLELRPAQLPLVFELRKDGFVPQTFRVAADVATESTVKVSLVPRRATPLVPPAPAR